MSDVPHGVCYLATPYSRYPAGIEAAYRDACVLAAKLIRAGVSVYSPIAHSHGIALHGKIDPLDQGFWYGFDRSMMHVCRTLIVAHMEGWESSSGIAEEIIFFRDRGREIWDCDVGSLQMARRPFALVTA